jgi:hypothetical protein
MRVFIVVGFDPSEWEQGEDGRWNEAVFADEAKEHASGLTESWQTEDKENEVDEDHLRYAEVHGWTVIP